MENDKLRKLYQQSPLSILLQLSHLVMQKTNNKQIMKCRQEKEKIENEPEGEKKRS